MVEYQIGNAIVRVHGSPDPDKLKEATARFLKQVEIQRKKVRNEARKKTHTGTMQVAAKVEA